MSSVASTFKSGLKSKFGFKFQKGVGLTEVLISMFVVGTGILGLSTMQISAKKTSYDALQRSIATSLARDFTERMRSNPSSAALAIYGGVNNIGGGTISSEPTPNCSSSVCTPSQLAAHDIWAWERSLDGAAESLNGNDVGGLVSPSACVSYNAGAVTLTIAWRGKEGKVNPTGSDCGTNLGKYGTNDTERKIVVLTTFIEEI